MDIQTSSKYQTVWDIQNDQMKMKTDLSKEITDGDDVQSFFRKLFYYAGISSTFDRIESKEANGIGKLVWNEYCDRASKFTSENFSERLRKSSEFTELVYGKMTPVYTKLCCSVLDLCFKPREYLNVEQSQKSAQARIGQVKQNLQKKKKELKHLMDQIEELETQLTFQESLLHN
jgi:hypothetical protein